MNRVLTWAEFKTNLKFELGIQTNETQQDDFLLALANEGLIQMAQSGKDMREFRIDDTWAFTDPDVLEIDDTVFANIEQVFYAFHPETILDWEYDLTEFSGVVGIAPPRVTGYPAAYSVRTNDLDADGPITTFKFYPATAGQEPGERLHVIGTGFKLIVDDTTRLYYFNLYPWLKASIMERYFIKRNDDPQAQQAAANLIQRTGSLAAGGTADKGDSVNSPQPKQQ